VGDERSRPVRRGSGRGGRGSWSGRSRLRVGRGRSLRADRGRGGSGSRRVVAGYSQRECKPLVVGGSRPDTRRGSATHGAAAPCGRRVPAEPSPRGRSVPPHARTAASGRRPRSPRPTGACAVLAWGVCGRRATRWDRDGPPQAHTRLGPPGGALLASSGATRLPPGATRPPVGRGWPRQARPGSRQARLGPRWGAVGPARRNLAPSGAVGPAGRPGRNPAPARRDSTPPGAGGRGQVLAARTAPQRRTSAPYVSGRRPRR
jgi:hypothetical protein